MSFPSSLVHFGQVLLDTLLPQRCVACGDEGVALCAACCQALPIFGTQGCVGCSRETGGSTCRTCRSTTPLVGILSLFAYDTPFVAALCNAFKHSAVTSLAVPLGKRLVTLLPLLPVRPTHVVPVPLSRQRERTRGYNQAALLATPLARALGLPDTNTILCRTRATPPQQNLRREERQKNVEGAFQCPHPLPRDAVVLLVDDVATSGATLTACAAALRTAGAQTVWAATLARRTLT